MKKELNLLDILLKEEEIRFHLLVFLVLFNLVDKYLMYTEFNLGNLMLKYYKNGWKKPSKLKKKVVDKEKMEKRHLENYSEMLLMDNL